MIFAVVSDMDNKENFVETYFEDEIYVTTRENRKKENSSLMFESIFCTYKEAIREAKRISKPTYVKGWVYNEGRNREIK